MHEHTLYTCFLGIAKSVHQNFLVLVSQYTRVKCFFFGFECLQIVPF